MKSLHIEQRDASNLHHQPILLLHHHHHHLLLLLLLLLKPLLNTDPKHPLFLSNAPLTSLHCIGEKKQSLLFCPLLPCFCFSAKWES
jgi:hypothetical protein